MGGEKMVKEKRERPREQGTKVKNTKKIYIRQPGENSAANKSTSHWSRLKWQPLGHSNSLELQLQLQLRLHSQKSGLTRCSRISQVPTDLIKLLNAVF